jgi:transposase
LETRRIDGYVPDPYEACALNRGRPARRRRWREPAHRRMVQKLRSPTGGAIYRRRKAIIEPVFGVLKQPRGLRRFRLRGLANVAVEITLAATAYNLTRMWRALTPK